MPPEYRIEAARGATTGMIVLAFRIRPLASRTERLAV